MGRRRRRVAPLSVAALEGTAPAPAERHGDETIGNSLGETKCVGWHRLTRPQRGQMIHVVMLDWLVQAYQRGPSFDAPVPFTNAQCAIEAANVILLRGRHERVRVYSATFAEVRADLEVPTDDVARLAINLETQARTAAVMASLQTDHKPSGPKH